MRNIPSKLPQIGTTIFTVMSRMATEYNAINLSQGFPGFDCDPRLIRWVEEGMRKGINQYAPMAGLPSLRAEIARIVEKAYGFSPDIDEEITLCSGATEGLMAAILALIHPGDEVILFDPSYDSYRPAISLAGGHAKGLNLKAPHFHIDWDVVEESISPRTTAIMINNPHNPSGAILSNADLTRLEEVAKKHDLLVFSDEVYEHIVFDGLMHESVLKYPELAARSVVFSSFGKTLHVTGWKVGYVVAPEVLTKEIRKVHQYTTFSTSTPFQYGIAEYLKRCEEEVWNLGNFYQAKRDVFRELISDTPLRLLPSKGSYFQLVSYKGLSELKDTEFVEYLTKEIGVAAIPISVFYEDGRDDKVIRFCFAKEERELAIAASRLKRLEVKA
ncbi:MAG: methionine aminotransferase [Bacteroidia bacterium]|nr:methionine aminotransferase [Bacteroidia bacterium]